ncbi:ATP-binding protein [Ramlibacter rhizophilus]|uniref:Histidine kinase/HSP90-like ATPase domain-containing protein n=1 Tax=Ramlibacter rhizophilus TaxID=1781167 RepID=A0A4Z0BRR3_9BURK|nr:ATP-binding protein [Ramlibacter rhizophilus]TFZ01432.1 hypothetical protein EZ242_08630 [Ramlibacter rhizophilus]
MLSQPENQALASPSAALLGGCPPAPRDRAAEDALFRQLVLDHRHRLYRFIVKHIGWGSDAEDLTQQAFVEAAHSYASFRGASELSTWLYQQRPDGRVLVQARVQDDALVIGITDFAPAFNPLLVPLPDTSLPLEARQPGGLGLLFVRRTADELHYRRVEGTGSPACNRVWFSKRLRPELTPSGSPGSVVA